MSLIDTYEIATGGQNIKNTFTLTSNGILLDITIEDLSHHDSYHGSHLRGNTYFSILDKEKKIAKKIVTIIATIGGKDYKESIIIKNHPNLKVTDLDIKITEGKIPTIKILLKS